MKIRDNYNDDFKSIHFDFESRMDLYLHDMREN